MPIQITCDLCGGPEAFNYPAGSGPPYLCEKCHWERSKPQAHRQRLHSIIQNSEIYESRCAPLLAAHRSADEAEKSLRVARDAITEWYRQNNAQEYDQMLYRHNESHCTDSDPHCLACHALQELGLDLDAALEIPKEQG